MNGEDIKIIMDSSIWIEGNFEVHGANSNGAFTSKITDKTRKNYVINVNNWRGIFNDIIHKIIDFSESNTITEVKLKQSIDLDIHKMEMVDREVTENSVGDEIEPGSVGIISRATAIIRKGMILYRYTDDRINHVYANPHPTMYGRFTDPTSETKHSVMYLAFEKNVAKAEVKGSPSNQLVKYRVFKDIVVLITPGALPSATQADAFFVERLRRFHNLLLSLQSSDGYFKFINNKDRLTKGIYITTNKLLEYLESNQNIGIVYPSTKVNQNSILGRIDNNAIFIPNNSNADIAIFNDIEKRDGKICSKYLEALI